MARAMKNQVIGSCQSALWSFWLKRFGTLYSRVNYVIAKRLSSKLASIYRQKRDGKEFFGCSAGGGIRTHEPLWDSRLRTLCRSNLK